MTELFKEAIAWYNLPVTALLGLVVLYWIVASIGVLGDGGDHLKNIEVVLNSGLAREKSPATLADSTVEKLAKITANRAKRRVEARVRTRA